MRPPRFPESSRGRLRWVIGESLVLAGVLLVWIGVALVLQFALTLIGLATVTLGFEALADPIVRAAHDTPLLWSAVSTLALITASLYAVARVGTLLIAHYRRATPE